MTVFPMRRLAAAAILTLFMTASAEALAHGGESHGEAPPPPPSLGATMGFGATTELFEAVLSEDTEGRTVLYLAEAATNRPVAGANIEVEIAEPAWKGMAKPGTGAGLYVLDWTIPHEGKADATLTVSAGGQEDLILVGNIGHLPHAHSQLVGEDGRWPVPWPYALGAAGLLAALVGGFRLLARHGKSATTIAFLLALLTLPGIALAHGDEDHGGGATPAIAAAAPGPRIVLPKASQFLLGIETVRIQAREVAETTRLVGHVEPDPSAYARVQPSQPSRVVSDPAFPVPVPGQQVRRGQVLAVLEPNLSNVERSTQRGALYKVESELSQVQQQLDRWSRLEGVVPRKDVENARTEANRLTKERDQLSRIALGRELLTTPIDGRVTDIHVVPGEMVGPDKAMVEIVESSRLWIEAVLFDLSLSNRLTGGIATTRLLPHEAFPLRLVGSSGRINTADQGLHVLFAVDNPKGLLKLGMPVDVHAETGTTRLSLAVPREALVERAGQTVVFIHTEPEVFEARPVRVLRLLGDWAELATGVADGERVVTQGAQQLRSAR